MDHLVLATRLRLMRETSGLTLHDAARALGSHTMTVRRIEAAETAADADQVATLLALYGASAEKTRRMLAGVAEANRTGWWHPHRRVMSPEQQRWIGVESAASVVRLWHGALVPDLLQTQDYARVLYRVRSPGDDAEREDQKLALLAERQTRLADRGARLWVLMSAAALHTMVGSPEIMRSQHEHLRAAAEQRHCTIQVVPLTAAPHPLTAAPPLRLLRIPVPEIGDYAVWDLPGDDRVDDDPAVVAPLRQAMDVAAGATPIHVPLPLPELPPAVQRA